MVSSNINLSATLMDDKKRVRLQTGPRVYDLTLVRAFALAHSLLKSKEFKSAIKVLEAIALTGKYDARTRIMLACCKANIHDYEACNNLLKQVFPEDTTAAIDRLQAAFVFDTVGMRWDAARELVELVNERPDLPSLCLLLGDLLASLGNSRKAAKCWQLAMKRDKNGGLVANAAKEEIAQLVKTMKNTPAAQDERPAP
jgi:hypothetical protein